MLYREIIVCYDNNTINKNTPEQKVNILTLNLVVNIVIAGLRVDVAFYSF
jgi:hypothetical protein